jgi:hypothetical protein
LRKGLLLNPRKSEVFPHESSSFLWVLLYPLIRGSPGHQFLFEGVIVFVNNLFAVVVDFAFIADIMEGRFIRDCRRMDKLFLELMLFVFNDAEVLADDLAGGSIS